MIEKTGTPDEEPNAAPARSGGAARHIPGANRVNQAADAMASWAGRAVRPVARLGVAAGLAAVVIATILYRWIDVDAAAGWILLCLAAVVLLIPGGVLLQCAWWLRELSELPETVRAISGSVWPGADRLREVAGTVRHQETRPPRGLLRSLWDLRGWVQSVADLPAPLALLAPLTSIPFLVAVLAATIIAPVEIVVAAVLLLIELVS